MPSTGPEVNEALPAEFRTLLQAPRRAPDDPRRLKGRREFRAKRDIGSLTWIRAQMTHIDHCIGQLLEQIDLESTFLTFTSDHGDHTGVAPPIDDFSGMSFRPLLQGTPPKSAADRSLICGRSVRRGDLKLIMGNEDTMLFDLASDPGETTDLAGDPANQAVAQELLGVWWAQMWNGIPDALAAPDRDRTDD